MDQNTQSRRPHYHRARRGSDRRGPDRRAAQPDQSPRPSGDQVDVEQIMREIRARISQRHGIELSTQQIQELAARRLEAILDPRTLNPSLLEQLRKGAATRDATAGVPEPPYSFDEATLFESHRPLLRFIRRLLLPVLKLFFNPAPLVQALSAQARVNSEIAAREAERDRVQAEWNALHYDILQRLVTEVSRVSIEVQSLALRVESLGARVDFNDRRVRSLEATPGQQARPQVARAPEQAVPSGVPVEAAPPESAAAPASTDGTRRRRRRRRGRRGSGGTPEGAAVPGGTAADELADNELADMDAADADEGEDDVSTGALAQVFVPDTAPAEAVAPVDASAPVPPQPTEVTPPPDEPAAPGPAGGPEPGPPER